MTAKLDPAHIDIFAQPRRRRRARVPEKLRPTLAKAEKRLHGLPAAPGTMMHPAKGDFDEHTYSSPYVDRNAWEVMLASAFSTRSVCTIQVFVEQIAGLCRKMWDEEGKQWVRDEGELNQCLNIVNGVKPRNEAEAALAVQACAVHLMQVRMSARILSQGWINPQDAAIAAKLARTYALLMETIQRGRGKVKTTKQNITVRYERHNHQHIHYETGGSDGNGSQAHATAARRTGRKRARACDDDIRGGPLGAIVEYAPGPALPSPDAVGGTVPLCRCQESARVPDARRSKGNGRAKG